MASQTKTALLADIAAKIVAGAPGSITEAEVQQLMRDIVDSTIGSILDTEITATGITLGSLPNPRRAMFQFLMSLYQDGIHIVQPTNNGSQQGFPILFLSSPGGSWELKIGESNQIINKKWYIGSGSGDSGSSEGLTSMMDLFADLSPPNGRTLIVRSSAVGAPGLAILNSQGYEKAQTTPDGRLRFLDPAHNLVLRSGDNTKDVHVKLNAAGTAWEFVDLTPGALPPASNGGNGDAYLGTLLPDVLAAQANTPIAALWCGGAGVSHASGFVTQYADLTGRAGGIGALAAGPDGGPAWDGTNERATFSGTQLLRTAASLYLRHDKPLSIILVATVPNAAVGGFPAIIMQLDADARRFGFKLEMDAPDDVLRVLYANAFAQSSVVASNNRRLLKCSTNNDPNAEIDIEVFNAAIATDYAGTEHSAIENNAFAVGGSTINGSHVPIIFNLAAIVHGRPNAAWMTVFKTWINSKALHAPVYV